jgi:hypothetical protein
MCSLIKNNIVMSENMKTVINTIKAKPGNKRDLKLDSTI